MAIADQDRVPPAWVDLLQRHAPGVANDFLADVRRYLTDGADRVPRGREAETLKNIVHAYIEDPANQEALLYDLALASLVQGRDRRVNLAGIVAAGSVTALGLALARRSR